ncbi:paired amphipathic helix protein Sin3-like 2 [Artemisia annua]|uniref:Paired amphipathic helix protein Sin3-like 2 n=1 Tax=Artemisia annua TaxID=35608 RepID=A0A2U1M5X3_ARTAN|nr:paired amphipathic helix protein Sin3-like 2 [Artemisia annua]
MASASNAARSKTMKRARILKLKLQNLRHYYDEPVEDYLARAKTMADCLASAVDDPVDIVACVISGLRADFWEVHTTLMARAEPPVSFYDLYSILVAHEATLKKNNAKKLRKAVASLRLLRISPQGNQSSGGLNGIGLKRLRDDTYNCQFKRPCGSTRGESSGQAQAHAGGAGGGYSSQQKVTTIDALKYLNIVKYTFQDKKGKYDMFTLLLGKFIEQRIDTAFVVESVKYLFKGRNELIVGLNAFLPKGYEIIITEDDEALVKTTTGFEEAKSFFRPFGSSPGKLSGQPQSPGGGTGGGGCSSAQKQKLTTIDAWKYFKDVRDTFRDNREKYHMFLVLMKYFEDPRIDNAAVVQKVKDLFKGHDDLLIGFYAFLPDIIIFDARKI